LISTCFRRGVAATSVAALAIIVVAVVSAGYYVESNTSSGIGSSDGSLVNSSSTASHGTSLANPDPEAGGSFGSSVALSGCLAVVGAPRQASGKVYLYNLTTMALVRTLINPSPEPGGFGESVATNGRLVMVGSSSGDVYVFDAQTGSLLHVLASPNQQFEYWFGFSLGLSGSLAVVGELNGNSTGPEGDVYIYNVTNGSLLRTLSSPNPQNGGDFGFSLAIDGGTLAVSAPSENSGQPILGPNHNETGFTAMGYVYLFNASTGSLLATLAGPNAPALGFGSLDFGNSVSIEGRTVLVGTLDGARAYVYDYLTGKLLSTLREPNPTENSFWGGTAISGNLAVIGACTESVGGQSLGGNAYVFDTATGMLVQTLSSPHPESPGYFGYSVAADGGEVVVGAPQEGPGGSAYLFTV
jgi:WD40 repeat protein